MSAVSLISPRSLLLMAIAATGIATPRLATVVEERTLSPTAD